MDLQIAADYFFKLFCTPLNLEVKIKWKYKLISFFYSIIKLEITILFSLSLSNHEKSAIYPLCRHNPFPLTFFEFEDVYKQLN